MLAWDKCDMDRVVLVVDDDVDFLEMVTMLVEDNLDARVVAVPDGRQALQLIKQTKPAVVLLDRQMPGIDGLEILQQLKSDPATGNIPVIICTAVMFSEKTSMAAGCTDFIEKPFDVAMLLGKIEQHIREV